MTLSGNWFSFRRKCGLYGHWKKNCTSTAVSCTGTEGVLDRGCTGIKLKLYEHREEGIISNCGWINEFVYIHSCNCKRFRDCCNILPISFPFPLLSKFWETIFMRLYVKLLPLLVLLLFLIIINCYWLLLSGNGNKMKRAGASICKKFPDNNNKLDPRMW